MVYLIVLIPTNMAVFVNLTKSLIARAAITGMPLLRPKWSKGRVHTCGLYNAEIYSSVRPTFATCILVEVVVSLEQVILGLSNSTG